VNGFKKGENCYYKICLLSQSALAVRNNVFIYVFCCILCYHDELQYLARMAPAERIYPPRLLILQNCYRYNAG